MKKESESTAKSRYEQPRISRVLLTTQEDMLLPASWNAGHDEPNLPIIEGDPDDGPGAKRNGGFWDDEEYN